MLACWCLGATFTIFAEPCWLVCKYLLISTKHKVQLRLVSSAGIWAKKVLKRLKFSRWEVRRSKLLHLILWGLWMCVPSFTANHPIVVEIFQLKKKLKSRPKSSESLSGSHECQILNICVQFYGKRNFTLNHKCQPHGGPAVKVGGSPKSAGIIPWGPWISVKKKLMLTC